MRSRLLTDVAAAAAAAVITDPDDRLACVAILTPFSSSETTIFL